MKQKRGFALMSAKKRRAISAKGGTTAHKLGKAHKWTKEEAAEAGRKGGTIRANRAKSRKS